MWDGEQSIDGREVGIGQWIAPVTGPSRSPSRSRGITRTELERGNLEPSTLYGLLNDLSVSSGSCPCKSEVIITITQLGYHLVLSADFLVSSWVVMILSVRSCQAATS